MAGGRGMVGEYNRQGMWDGFSNWHLVIGNWQLATGNWQLIVLFVLSSIPYSISPIPAWPLDSGRE
jgi:hypothetical protein